MVRASTRSADGRLTLPYPPVQLAARAANSAALAVFIVVLLALSCRLFQRFEFAQLFDIYR